MARRKIKNGEKSPWGSCLTRLMSYLMSYQTTSKRSPPFWLLIGARKILCFSAQSEARMAATVWNWSGKTLSPGLFSPFFTFLRAIFFHPSRLSLAPTICPWFAEDGCPCISLSAVASDSAPAGQTLLRDKSKFVRVVFVFSAVESDSAPEGPTLLPYKCKFVRLVFLFSAVVTPHRQDQRYCETNPNLSEFCLFLTL